MCDAGANVYYTLEKYEEAIADCERAIQIDPTFTKVSKQPTFRALSFLSIGVVRLGFLQARAVSLRASGLG